MQPNTHEGDTKAKFMLKILEKFYLDPEPLPDSKPSEKSDPDPKKNHPTGTKLINING
jgi:hypothetical protein